MKTRLMVKCGVSLGVAVLVAAVAAAAEFVSPQAQSPANGAAAAKVVKAGAFRKGASASV